MRPRAPRPGGSPRERDVVTPPPACHRASAVSSASATRSSRRRWSPGARCTSAWTSTTWRRERAGSSPSTPSRAPWCGTSTSRPDRCAALVRPTRSAASTATTPSNSSGWRPASSTSRSGCDHDRTHHRVRQRVVVGGPRPRPRAPVLRDQQLRHRCRPGHTDTGPHHAALRRSVGRPPDGRPYRPGVGDRARSTTTTWPSGRHPICSRSMSMARPTDVVGIGNKDGTYYVVDRDGVNDPQRRQVERSRSVGLPYWATNVVPGGAIGGIIATASVDEATRRVFFSTAPANQRGQSAASHGARPRSGHRCRGLAEPRDRRSRRRRQLRRHQWCARCGAGRQRHHPAPADVRRRDGTLLFDEIIGQPGTLSGIASGAGGASTERCWWAPGSAAGRAADRAPVTSRRTRPRRSSRCASPAPSPVRVLLPRSALVWSRSPKATGAPSRPACRSRCRSPRRRRSPSRGRRFPGRGRPPPPTTSWPPRAPSPSPRARPPRSSRCPSSATGRTRTTRSPWSDSTSPPTPRWGASSGWARCAYSTTTLRRSSAPGAAGSPRATWPPPRSASPCGCHESVDGRCRCRGGRSTARPPPPPTISPRREPCCSHPASATPRSSSRWSATRWPNRARERLSIDFVDPVNATIEPARVSVIIVDDD